jgi:uncharacterized protein (TIGR01777 family)
MVVRWGEHKGTVMRVIIAGATGFIGRALCRELHGDCEIIALSRDVARAARALGEYAKAVEWDARTASSWARHVEGAHAIINLAGDDISSGRWTQAKRDSIMQSRTNSANAILDAVSTARNKPAVVIQASGVNYYGSRGEDTLDEGSPSGSGFLAEVTRRVESIVARTEKAGVRWVATRSGVVLGREGGALPRFMMPFRFYVGGYVGSGRQWLSWISLRDEIRALRFLMDQPNLQGAFNFTAPNPVTARQFARTLGQVLHRPAWTFLPGFAARLAFGQMANEVLLASQKAVPRRLTEAGFPFEYADLRTALEAILRGGNHESE